MNRAGFCARVFSCEGSLPGVVRLLLGARIRPRSSAAVKLGMHTLIVPPPLFQGYESDVRGGAPRFSSAYQLRVVQCVDGSR